MVLDRARRRRHRTPHTRRTKKHVESAKVTNYAVYGLLDRDMVADIDTVEGGGDAKVSVDFLDRFLAVFWKKVRVT